MYTCGALATYSITSANAAKIAGAGARHSTGARAMYSFTGVREAYNVGVGAMSSTTGSGALSTAGAGVMNSTGTSALCSILGARGVHCKCWRDVLHHGREHGVGCKRWRIVLDCGRWYCGRHGGDSRRGSWCGVHHSTVLGYRRSDRVRHCKNGAVQQNAAQQRGLSRKRVLISVTHGHGAIADTTDHAETNQSRLFSLVTAAQSVQSALVVARILHDDCLRLRFAH